MTIERNGMRRLLSLQRAHYKRAKQILGGTDFRALLSMCHHPTLFTLLVKELSEKELSVCKVNDFTIKKAVL